MMGMSLEPKFSNKLIKKNIGISKENQSIIYHWLKVPEKKREEIKRDIEKDLEPIFEADTFRNELPEIFKKFDNSKLTELLIDDLYKISSAEHRNRKFLNILESLRKGNIDFKKEEIKKVIPVLYAVLKELKYI